MSKEVSRAIAGKAYKTYEKKLCSEVIKGKIPHHLAIIMDGNRRFAREFGLNPLEGHEKGKDKLEEVMEWCLELGIKILMIKLVNSYISLCRRMVSREIPPRAVQSGVARVRDGGCRRLSSRVVMPPATPHQS